MKTKVIGRIIIILIILIAILGGVFAYLYFGTDLLKTIIFSIFRTNGRTRRWLYR